MVISNHIAPLIAGTPQVLPPQDRALAWACSACFHTLALAVASVATMLPRELPQSQAAVTRLEIRMADARQEAEQAPAADSQSQADPTPPHETAAIADDSSPIVPAPSPSIVRRTAQRVAAETPAPHTAEAASTVSDPVPVESAEPIEPLSEPSASVNEPDPPTPPSPTEAVEQAELATSIDAPLEPIEKHLDEHAELSAQPEASASPQTNPTPPTSMAILTRMPWIPLPVHPRKPSPCTTPPSHNPFPQDRTMRG